VTRTVSAQDWAELRDLAAEMTECSYAPYSQFRVGCAGLTDDGRIVVGCNVENGSYGLSLCAECGLVSQLFATGGGRLVAVACRANGDHPVLPCGRCRQLLHEAGGAELLVDGDGTARRLGELLPEGFELDREKPQPETDG
jgi:cytidine deaminase